MNLKLVRFLDKYIGIPICYTLGIFDGLKKLIIKSKKKEIRNVLLIRFWGLGNMVLLSPTIAAIRQHFPNAKIIYLSLEENKSLLDINKNIDETFYLKLGNPVQVALRCVKIFFMLRKKKIDLVIDFEQFAKLSSIFAYFTGASERVGFATEGQGRTIIYTKKVKYNNNQHIVVSFFNLAESLGIQRKKLEIPPIDVSAKDKKTVDGFLKKMQIKGSFVCLHPSTGPNAPERIWPKENYAKLADHLIEIFGTNVVFTGSTREAKGIAAIMAMMKHKEKSNDASGKVNIPQLAYLIGEAGLLISSDTGPLHLATAMKTPTISFYGPNTPKIYGPWGNKNLNIVIYRNLWCSPCMSNFNAKLAKCINPTYAKCIRDISVEEVLQKVEGILKSGSSL